MFASRWKQQLCAFGFSMLCVASADATPLLGSSVTLRVDYPTLGTSISTSATRVVAPTAVFILNTDVVPTASRGLVSGTITVADTTIDIAFTQNSGLAVGQFNGYVFDFVGASPITSAVLDPASSYNSSQVTVGFSANQVTVNVAGIFASNGSLIRVSLAGGEAPSEVPEPGSLILLGGGLSLLFGARIRAIPR